MSKHSKIGASSSKRWMTCPGSVRLSDGLVSKTSSFAAEGSAAHAVAEKCLTNGYMADRYAGQTVEGFEVDNEMVEAVNLYLKTIREDHGGIAEMDIECRFDLSHLHKGLYGTADCVLYMERSGTLGVYDFKYGAGVPVEVEHNPQLLYYALGAVHAKGNRPIKGICLTVVQPRCHHPQGPVRRWVVDPLDLLDWSFDLTAAAKRTEDPDAPTVTGDHCRWCPAAGICPKLASTAQEAAKQEFTAVTPYDPAALAQSLAAIPLVEDWIKAVKEFADTEAKQGRCPPGYKLVQTLGNRRWEDEAEARRALFGHGLKEEDIIKPGALRSPTDIEKLLGKKDFVEHFADYVTRPAGVSLALESDKRPAIRADVKGEFRPDFMD